MQTTLAQPAEAEIDAEFEARAGADDVFSLPAILDPSAALAAARRLYAQNRTGVRFFCENRRVVSVDEAEAMGETLTAFAEPDTDDTPAADPEEAALEASAAPA